MKRASERPAIQRRQLVGAAGTTGALVAAATLLPSRQQAEAEATAPKPVPEQGGGYRVTAHVLRYYQTTKV